MPLDQVVHQAFSPLGSMFNFGYTDDTIWAKVQAHESQSPARHWLIAIGIPYLDEVDAYQRIDGQWDQIHKGRGISLWSKPYPHRDSLIPVSFDDRGDATVFLRLRSRDGTTVNARMVTVDHYFAQDHRARFFFGGYFGVMLAMAVYNFFLFLSLRDRRYLYYVLFTLAVAANVAAHYEFFHEFLLHGSDWLNSHLNIFTFCLAILASIKFVQNFLQTRERLPRLNRLYQGFQGALVGVAAYAALADNPGTLPLFCVLLPLLALIAITAVHALRYHDDPSARYFIVAFGLFISGVGMFSLRRFGLLPASPVVNFTFLAGSIAETMLLSFALANRINVLYDQKETAQNQLIAHISEHNRSLVKLRDELEDTVRIRTERLTTSLQEKEVLLKEIHHRVKNNLAIVESLLGFQIRQADNSTDIRSELKAAQSRIRSMAFVHELLNTSENLARVNARDYLLRLTESLKDAYAFPGGPVTLNCFSDSIELPMDVLTSCGLIASELVTNAFKHAFPSPDQGGTIELAFKHEAARLVMSVRDDGCGLAEDNREHLGMRLVRIMTEQLNGHIEVLRQEAGTSWQLTIPEGQE